MRNDPVAWLELGYIRAYFHNRPCGVAPGNVWKRGLDRLAPYRPEIIVIISRSFDLDHHFGWLYLGNIDIFDLDDLCRILVILSEYCCLHKSRRTFQTLNS